MSEIQNKEIQPQIQTQKQEATKVTQDTESIVQLSSNELSNEHDEYEKLVKEHRNLTKEYRKLKKMIVKSYLQKYHISEPINLNSLNYESLEAVEKSLTKYCEDKNISYTSYNESLPYLKLHEIPGLNDVGKKNSDSQKKRYGL